MNCNRCRFWDYNDDFTLEGGEPMERYGRCHRFPPFGRKLTIDNHGREQYLDVDGWPLVEGGDWCGEWQEDAPSE